MENATGTPSSKNAVKLIASMSNGMVMVGFLFPGGFYVLTLGQCDEVLN